MKIARFFLALMLGISVLPGVASAQVGSPSLTPPGVAPRQGITLPAAEPDEKDEIVIIPGPKIGRQEKPQLTGPMLEMLYRAVWMKIGKEYQDPFKLQDWASWENKYKGKLTNEAELDAALKDMIGSLNDRWTIYYSPTDIAEQQKAAKEGYISIGMLLRRHKDNAWHIDGMSFASPAQASVLREGDVIKSINGESLDKLSQGDVSKKLRGKEGEKVTVLAVIDGKEQSVELTYAPHGANQVAVGMLPGNIVYIRLPTFVSQETVGNFVQALTQVYEATDGQINGLVFDLRYNSGGLVTMALAVSSMFMEDGTITATTTRQDRSITETHYKVMPVPQYLQARMPAQVNEFTQWLQTVPLVVLTNGSTASASEITTGALKDTGRAYVIGTHTFGKAVGYTMSPLPNGGGLQVTNLSYLTPNGSNIADKGIDPNKVVEQPRGQAILGEGDEQVKAAHEYLLKVAQARAKQLADAQKLATNPQGAEAGHPLVLHPLYVLFAVLGAAGLVSITLFAVSRKLKRNRR